MRPRDLERARGGVERVEEPVAHAHVGAGEGVEQGRLAGVRVPGERDRREPGALALRAHHAARGLGVLRAAAAAPRCGRAPGGGRSRSGSRPGPWCRCRRPCVRRPGARGASRARACGRGCTRAGPAPPGACPRPSSAWSAKMSRIIAVRSITGTPSCLLEVALLARQQLVVAGHQVRVRVRDRALQLGELALARDSGRGPARSRRWASSPGHRHAGGAQQLAQLGQIGLVRGRRRSESALARPLVANALAVAVSLLRLFLPRSTRQV